MSDYVYYAQNREDKWIAENLPLPEKGFYVDVGCGHPFTTSNTAFLRDRKWEGLAIDGNRTWAEDWKHIPAFCCAVIASQPEVLFCENAWWSRIGIGTSRSAETLEAILERFSVGKIDFLSVDVEGSEFEILQSFDFDLHDPSIVVAEYNAMHLPIVEPEQSPIPDFMADKGYFLEKVFGCVNMVFAK